MSCHVMSCHVMSCYVILCYIILLLYITSHSPPHLFIRNHHPPLPHSIVRRTLCCTYPFPYNNVLTCYDIKLNMCKSNTYPHTSSPPLQSLTPVCNPSILHVIITNISTLYYYYYYVLVL